MKQGRFYFLIFTCCFGISIWFQNCSQFQDPKQNAEMGESSLSMNHPDVSPNIEKSSGGITLIDRVGLTSALENIFIPEPSSSSDRNTFFYLVNTEIRPQQHAYGRPCDILGLGNFSECHLNLSNLELGMWQSTSTVRESSRLQLCRRLVSNDSLLNNVIKQVQGQDLTPSESSMLNSVNLFYPAWEPEELKPIVQALAALDYKMAANSETMINRWRLAILVICESAYWEIL